MKNFLLVTGIVAGLAANACGQSLLLDNRFNTGGIAAQTNGRAFMSNGTLFDGTNYNLGVTIFGGPSPNNLSPLGTYTLFNDPKGHTGYGAGTFQLGFPSAPVTIPGVAPSGIAFIRLQMWFDGVGGLFPNYAAAVAGAGDTADVTFQNPTGDPGGLPPLPAPTLTGMPSVILGVLCLPPWISQQPQSQSVALGGTATFSVVAITNFNRLLRYQWQFNGTEILLATNEVLILTNVQPSQAGAYSVFIYNGCSNAGTNSTNAILTVLDPPRITNQPQGTVGYWGGSASFSVIAQGASLSYLWSKDGGVIPWATNSTLTLTHLDFTNTGIYWVTITNLYGRTNSAEALLVVNPAGVWLGMHPFLTITGTVGKTFDIQYAAEVSQTNSWIFLTNLTLTAPVQEWIDTSVDAIVASRRYYRVVPVR